MYIYIYIHIYREREIEREGWRGEGESESTLDRRRNILTCLKDFHLKAKARICPGRDCLTCGIIARLRL